jgi:polyisoprenoid-binding protein YceI
MKNVFLVAAVLIFTSASYAQKKRTTTSATVSFDATTTLDPLPKAENRTVVAALDTKKGTLQFEATVKSFSFANPMMQGHFNGKQWMDSDQFPTATFKGKITDIKSVKFSKDGSYNITVEGDLTIHGVTNKITSPAVITVADGKISSTASFSVKLADYSVDGPQVGAGKVSKEPKITVSASF